MSTPQNPNEPDNGHTQDRNPADSQGPADNQDPRRSDHGQDHPGAHEQPGAQDPTAVHDQAAAQEQQGAQEAQTGYQQGTYDPNAYSSYQAGADRSGDYQQPSDQPGYSQDQTVQNAGYGQPGAYSQPGGYSQAGAYSQPAGAYAQPGAYSQPGAGYPQGYGQPGYAQPQTGEKGFFKSLFDFRFDNFIAVKWSGFIYIIAIVVAVLSYLGTIIAGISTGIAAGSAASYFTDGPSFSVLPLILSILFGWIIPALWVIAVRLVLELIVSNIKTAQHTKRIADSVDR